ncbi:tetratricopeptide repeat protein [Rhodopirellula sp. MGV]|uniref:tetratricopeptide repeat protein n=1 Tax=Rhodopirellula sp. MGV TaxID=2023130 RepID=UPI00117B4BF9|nr:hypothetical protein [Rhodopirellula sp. MGV]
MTAVFAMSYRKRMIGKLNRYLLQGLLCFTFGLCLVVGSGCRVTAPVHRWVPPGLHAAVDQTVVLSEIEGPAELAASLRQRLLDTAPRDEGRKLAIIDVNRLRQQSSDSETNPIALVSHQESVASDVSLLPLAKRGDVNYLLRGEVLVDQTAPWLADRDQRLVVSWCLTPVNSDRDLSPGDDRQQSEHQQAQYGTPLTINLADALKKYPDLAWLNDKHAALETAMVRETFALLSPTVQRDKVRLDNPLPLPGSWHTVAGNFYAKSGRWADAETQWQRALKWNPFSSAAMHNLALAKSAKQDFSQARHWASRSVVFGPTKRHQRAAVWVEQAQRDYHEAFDLADPPEGWSVTRPVE